ncbi:MAG: hypothetical protein ACE5I3_09775 [Phycisphaerae bacterium]
MRMSCATNVIALVVGLNSPTALADDFDGCGFLIQGVECVLFQADSGGVYVLDNYGSFEVGDRVHVAGVLDPYCITFCMQGDGCILDNTISDCFGDFEDCGLLIQGVECVLFQADSGGVYVLDNYGSFEVGDRVHVAGVLDPYCITFCMQGDGCILDNTIGPCECLGDLDYDGDVDLSDLAQLLANYGTTSGASYEDGDIEGDGDVDLSDLAALLANYGTTCE